ncbi:MAG: hypothetical protein GKR90_22520 [Pseudomonadales bacterium]|nr:hypothetical protein [Pseudomonadales bacterium]
MILSPCQRGANEIAKQMLRPHFPNGTDLSEHSSDELDRVTRNTRGRPGVRWTAQHLQTGTINVPRPGESTARWDAYLAQPSIYVVWLRQMVQVFLA